MTFAMKTDDARALLAERFGEDLVPLEEPAPTSDGARARFVATMHALIAWVLAHPELPVPWTCSINMNTPNVADLVQAYESLGTEASVALTEDGVPYHLVVFNPVESEFYTPISIHLKSEDERPLRWS